jgi:hypothetical protein
LLDETAFGSLMKWWFGPVVLLCFLACRDPNSYQPFDPTKPDPPAPPVLDYPANGWVSDDFAYPQNVSFAWQAVPDAQFYEMQVSKDSLFQSIYIPLGPHIYKTSTADSIRRHGRYYWRVRAASSRWNDYTEWSLPFHFTLPNPGR